MIIFVRDNYCIYVAGTVRWIYENLLFDQSLGEVEVVDITSLCMHMFMTIFCFLYLLTS